MKNSSGQPLKVWDKHQIGIGLDMRPENNPIVQEYLHSKNGKRWVSEADEHYSRQRMLLDKEKTLNRLLKKKGLNLQLSPNKKAMAIGLVYHGFAPKLFSNPTLYNSFVNGTEK